MKIRHPLSTFSAHLLLTGIITFSILHAQADLPASGEIPHHWPRSFTNDTTAFTVYQPQATGWSNGILTFREALAVTLQGAAQPTFGTVTLCAMTSVDNEQQTVALSDVSIVSSTFPSVPDQAISYASQLAAQSSQWGQHIPLQAIEANLAVTAAEGAASNPVPVRNTPPTLFFSPSPALLVLVDGSPALRSISGSSLLRVINTQALIALDQSTGNYYLRVNGAWAQAQKITGPWAASANPPSSLASLLQQASTAGNVQLFDPPQGQNQPTPLPIIYVSTTPAELITTQGPPAFEPISGTQLLHATNTGSSLFMNVANQTYYVVISGRWFSSPALTGSWQFVPANQLPSDFANIPENAPAGTVLASVAGTPQASEAAISATIPQTATISRTATTNVAYAGDPEFQQILGTELSYAPNTETPVIKVASGKYYAVVNGVWFKALSPNGPWVVAESVPPAIYTIPPSCPIYYVTYVTVYSATPEAVYVGYTPGYFGTCLSPEGVVVFGTGYYYPPYIGPDIWIGPPLTYGFGAGFSCGLATGFAFGMAVDHGWGCTPWWGPWHGGWGTWNGNGNFNRNVTNNWNNVNVNGHNAYNRWGNNQLNNSHLSQSQKNTAQSDYNQAKSNYESNHSGAAEHQSPVDRNTLRNDSSHLGENNVFAGKDGNAYRSTTNGDWQQHSSSGWKDANPSNDFSQSTHSDLNNQRYSRNIGNYRSAGFGGGGFHGGGGFRR